MPTPNHFDWQKLRHQSQPQRVRLLDRLAGRLTDGVLRIVATEQRSQLQNRTAARVDHAGAELQRGAEGTLYEVERRPAPGVG